MSEASMATAPGQDFAVRTVEADGFEVRYCEAGEGEPIVWIHGARGPGFSFALDDLASDHRVLVIELPGFGESALNERTENAAQMAETLSRVLSELEVAPAHVWGTSMGCVVATHLASDHPESVKSLILEGPGVFRAGAVDPRANPMTPEEMSAALNNHPGRVAWRPPLAPPDPDRMALVLKLMGSDLEARLASIQVPTLAFWGIDDGVSPPENGRFYKERMPHCSYVLVYDAAHDVQGDRPEAVAAMIRDFVARGHNFVVNNVDGRVAP